MSGVDLIERCASALGRPVPVDVDEVVRVIVDGSAALGLVELAGPFRHDLDLSGDAHQGLDDVARCLVALPRRPPVVLYVSGPVWIAADPGDDDGLDPDRLDDAVDFVAARIRELAGIRPDRIEVVEPTGEHLDGPGLEAHQTLRRIAAHLNIPFTIAPPAGG